MVADLRLRPLDGKGAFHNGSESDDSDNDDENYNENNEQQQLPEGLPIVATK